LSQRTCKKKRECGLQREHDYERARRGNERKLFLRQGVCERETKEKGVWEGNEGWEYISVGIKK